MEAGLGVLGLSPPTFWAMTPRELDAALRGRLGGRAADTGFSRSDLDQLMQQFPDT
jgi:uncharacterized phage protein (TIGR02216 family)